MQTAQPRLIVGHTTNYYINTLYSALVVSSNITHSSNYFYELSSMHNYYSGYNVRRKNYYSVRTIHSCWQACMALQISSPKHLNSINSGQTRFKTMLPETLSSIWFIVHTRLCSNLFCSNSTNRLSTRLRRWQKHLLWTWCWQRRLNTVTSCHLIVISSKTTRITNNHDQI